jgi:MFS family permease
VWLLVRNRPEDRGLALDGAGNHRAAPLAPVAPALGLAQLLRQRNFWALGMAVGLVFALLGALLVNLHPYATDLGVGAAAGAWLFTLLSVSGIAGKLAFGALADRVSKRLLMAVGMAMLAGFLLLLLSEPDYELLAWACALVGLALGGFLPIWGALIGECWGREAFARVMGLMSPLMSPLVMAAVAVPGFVHDRTGSYALAFQIFLVALALAGTALALLRVPSRPASQPI